MNIFTGWTGWPTFAVLILCGWLLRRAAVAAAWHLTKRAYTRHHIRATATRRQVNDRLRQQRLREHLHAEAERLGDAWPDDLCAYPPCSTEDGWVCDQHQPKPLAERVGKHRAVWSVPLDDQPGEVIQAVVTDLKERRQQ